MPAGGMKNVHRASKQWIAAVLVWVAAWAPPARAGYDTFGLGTGRDGALTVSAAGKVVNQYAQVVAPIAPGDTSIEVQSAVDFQPGYLILIHQTTGLIPVPASGSSTTINLDSSGSSVGFWELARVSKVVGSHLELTEPLVRSYAASVTQVVHVPEYTSVQVESTGTILASPWNGSTGGIIAFLVQGDISNSGTISATGAGFRGGAYVKATDVTGCTGLNEAAPNGAQKGEGIALGYGPSHTGRGNVTTAGGGGVCLKSGGGGGGHWGTGGVGGLSHSSLDGARSVGGMGGVNLSYNPAERLLFGGGGGAGHGTAGTGGAAGNGGGIVFIRANRMPGAGSILANGDNARVSDSGMDAGSGGGAGGSVYLRFVGDAACSAVRARGGRGSSTNAGSAYVGPGGGGSGGVIQYQSSGATCPLSVSLGFYGDKQDSTTTPYGSSYGAAAGQPGTIYPPSSGYTYGYIIPSVPTVQLPTNGQSFKLAYVTLETTGPGGNKGYVASFVNGVQNKALTRTASGSSTFQATLGPLAEGQYVIEFSAVVDDAWSPKSAPITIRVDLTPPDAPVVSAPGEGVSLNTRRPTISGTAEADSTVQVVINDSDEGTTTATAAGTWSFTLTRPLSDGEYRVKARATDAAGNVSTDSAVRVFSVLATAPTTTIDEAPPAQTQQTSATFRFSADTTATFQCNLDGAGFVDCTSPYTTPNLSAGAHTFEVRARDSSGNVEDPPVSYTWTITNGTPDGGGDAGTPDGGSNPDGGNGDGEEQPGGCGCAASGFDPAMSMMVLAGLAAFVSRRRRQ